MTIDKNYYDLSRKLLDELDRGMEEGPELSGVEMLARCAYAGEEAARPPPWRMRRWKRSGLH